MAWLDKIRNQNHESKVRLIWISAGVLALILLIAWILVGQRHISSNQPSAFNSLKQQDNAEPLVPVPQIFNNSNSY